MMGSKIWDALGGVTGAGQGLPKDCAMGDGQDMEGKLEPYPLPPGRMEGRQALQGQQTLLGRRPWRRVGTIEELMGVISDVHKHTVGWSSTRDYRSLAWDVLSTPVSKVVWGITTTETGIALRAADMTKECQYALWEIHREDRGTQKRDIHWYGSRPEVEVPDLMEALIFEIFTGKLGDVGQEVLAKFAFPGKVAVTMADYTDDAAMLARIFCETMKTSRPTLDALDLIPCSPWTEEETLRQVRVRTHDLLTRLSLGLRSTRNRIVIRGSEEEGLGCSSLAQHQSNFPAVVRSDTGQGMMLFRSALSMATEKSLRADVSTWLEVTTGLSPLPNGDEHREKQGRISKESSVHSGGGGLAHRPAQAGMGKRGEALNVGAGIAVPRDEWNSVRVSKGTQGREADKEDRGDALLRQRPWRSAQRVRDFLEILELLGKRHDWQSRVNMSEDAEQLRNCMLAESTLGTASSSTLRAFSIRDKWTGLPVTLWESMDSRALQLEEGCPQFYGTRPVCELPDVMEAIMYDLLVGKRGSVLEMAVAHTFKGKLATTLGDFANDAGALARLLHETNGEDRPAWASLDILTHSPWGEVETLGLARSLIQSLLGKLESGSSHPRAFMRTEESEDGQWISRRLSKRSLPNEVRAMTPGSQEATRSQSMARTSPTINLQSEEGCDTDSSAGLGEAEWRSALNITINTLEGILDRFNGSPPSPIIDRYDLSRLSSEGKGKAGEVQIRKSRDEREIMEPMHGGRRAGCGNYWTHWATFM
jgi:hypothetical protein